MNKLDIRNLYLADFGHNFNKACQRFSDVILQEGSGVAVIPTLAKKNHVWARWGKTKSWQSVSYIRGYPKRANIALC